MSKLFAVQTTEATETCTFFLCEFGHPLQQIQMSKLFAVQTTEATETCTFHSLTIRRTLDL